MLRAIGAALAGLMWAGVAQRANPAAPVGQLSDTIKPTAYRLELAVDPSRPTFAGHTEIDAVLARRTRTLFLHGNGLRVSSARVIAGQQTFAASYSEVHESGVARLDLPRELPAGALTLTFDYEAGFRTGAEGLFRAEVGGSWYAWTQMEPIDARRMFPGFDEPRFKTPFTVTVTAPKDAKVVANTPELAAMPSGEMTVHRFAPTAPLPTYLLALGVGPFDVVEATVPASAVRPQPLPLRVIATRGQTTRMTLAAVEAPKLLALLERYLRMPYPFEKLDLLATPILGGAMENAGLVVFDDRLLLLDADAPMSQLRQFGEVTAHELAHQWFGDLVTPAWWTDIWLNESFAEWMGKKVGDEWRPELGIAATELSDAFAAMQSDSLGRGRPMRQEIVENRQIASTFDEITYLKGAQVLSMFESYVGSATFAEGVRLHLTRHRYGTASADDFFRSIGEAAHDAKIVRAMRTFTDQTGVPVVSVNDEAQPGTARQSRYRPLGVEALPPQTWTIPVCVSRGTSRSCALLESSAGPLPDAQGTGALMPNAGGAGYYRFSLSPAGWGRLIGAARSLPGREAMALADSVWAEFAAGSGSFARVIDAARALSAHSEQLAALELGTRLTELARTALTPDERARYHELMRSIYAPRLAALGLDPRTGGHAGEPAATQRLRQSLVPLVALEGRDSQVRAQLAAAAEAFLGGDTRAIDPAFRETALTVAIQERGPALLFRLRDAMVASTDPLFRQHAGVAIGGVDTSALAESALDAAQSAGLQPMETVQIVLRASRQPGAREVVTEFVDKNFTRLAQMLPGFARPSIVRVFDGYCSTADRARVDGTVRPRLKELGGGELELAQTRERIMLCAALRAAKGAEVRRVLAQ